ncbi:mechanosensitive ion channel family protein [Candidatus Nomurabacteria bacterium]|nr:mechanosensitive ion channel family protein [Candidatus Nomurabacteria bacterium]
MSVNDFLRSTETWMSDHWGKMLFVLVIGLVAYYLGAKIVKLVVNRAVKVGGEHRVWHRKDIEKRQKTLENLFVNIWRIIVTVSLIYAFLAIFIPDVTSFFAPLFASAGIIGIALGFGAQSLIKDFISGIFIISENQFRVGDVVELATGSGMASGTVEKIGTRSTVLRDINGNVHFIPNGLITHAINKTMGFSVARFTIAVKPDSDIDTAIALIDKVGLNLSKEKKWKPKIISPPSYAMIGEITGSSLEMTVSGKTQPSDQWSVIAEMRRRLHFEFDKAGIELAVNPFANVVAGQDKKK